MKETIAQIISALVVIYIVFCAFGLMVGSLTALDTYERPQGCTYLSIAARSNLGYIGACEFLKPRFISAPHN